MMKLGYVIIYVENVKATMAFYAAAFGLETKMLFEQGDSADYGELQTGETVLAFAAHSLGQANLNGEYQKVSATGRPFGYELAMVSEDVAMAYKRAVAAGAVPIAAPQEKPWGQTVAYVRAVEGTLIELCSPVVA
jgi:lactoylglutathione lyase